MVDMQKASHGKPNSIHRRNFFHRVSDGLQGAALAYLATHELTGRNTIQAADHGLATAPRRIYDLRPQPTHFEPKAKAVIQHGRHLLAPLPQVDASSPGTLLGNGRDQAVLGNVDGVWLSIMRFV